MKKKEEEYTYCLHFVVIGALLCSQYLVKTVTLFKTGEAFKSAARHDVNTKCQKRVSVKPLFPVSTSAYCRQSCASRQPCADLIYSGSVYLVIVGLSL